MNRRAAWAFMVASCASFWVFAGWMAAPELRHLVTPKAHYEEHPVHMACFPPGTEKRKKVGGSDGCSDIDPPAEYSV